MNRDSLTYRRLVDTLDARYKPRIEALNRRINDLEHQLQSLSTVETSDKDKRRRKRTRAALVDTPTVLSNGTLLRIIRGTLGFSVSEAADVYGVPPKRVSEWETGEIIVTDDTVDLLRNIMRSTGDSGVLDIPSPHVLVQGILDRTGLTHEELAEISNLGDALDRWTKRDGTATEAQLRTLYRYAPVQIELDVRNSANPAHWAWVFQDNYDPAKPEPMTDLPPLIEMLKEIREHTGTQVKMAEYIKLPSRKTIGHWLAGRHEPSDEHRKLIEDAYKRLSAQRDSIVKAVA